MRSALLRAAFLCLPLTAAAFWAGCSSDDPDAQPEPTDAGADVLEVDATTEPPAEDAGTDSGKPAVDCATDLADDGIPKHLQCTGLYQDFASKTIAKDARAYTPGATFWSDGATKRRFVHLPPGAKIDITNFDEWKFPKGTKLWKEFTLDGKLVETRMIEKLDDTTTWGFVTYVWNADATEAVRNDDGVMIPRDDKGPAYEVPEQSQCTYCHLGRVEPVLGFEAVSLGLPGAAGVTLEALAKEGSLSAPPPATSFTIPDDGTTKAPAAFAWLHANCGHCHNGNTNAAAMFAAHFLIRASQLVPDGGVASGGELDAVQTSCERNSPLPKPGGGSYKYLVPGDPANSAMAVISGQRAPEGTMPSQFNQMPPIVTHRVDTEGRQHLVDWITALAACPAPPP